MAALGLASVSLRPAAQRLPHPAAPVEGVAVPRRRITAGITEDRSRGVLTYHNDWGRTGQNLDEPLLTPATVNPGRFGLLKTDYQVDGLVLGQPLYVPDVNIDGDAYNVVIVVTEHDTVYAFDADVDRHPQHWAAPLWARSLLGPGATPVPAADQHDEAGGVCTDISPEIGITSTPVVDPQSGVLYVVAKSKEADQSDAYTIHALDVATGLEKGALGAPVRLDAPGFGALRANQRAGLALADGVVYAAFASYCDQTPYHGWLLGYDTTRGLARVVAFDTTPGGDFGGIWASGAAPAIDTDASLFVAVGNGPYDPDSGQWGDTVLKLPIDRPTITQPPPLAPLDYFAPFNQEFLFANDLDLGSGGVMLLPDQPGPHLHVAIAGGKQGLIYVMDRDRLTARNSHQTGCPDAALQALIDARAEDPPVAWTDTCDPVVQVLQNGQGPERAAVLPSASHGPGVFSTPAYWNMSVYIGAAGDNLKMFAIEDGLLRNVPVSMSPDRFPWPGVTPSISASGASNGIVWAVDSGDVTNTPAVLYAFDAGDLSHVLYKSTGTLDDERRGIAAPDGRDTMTIGRRFAVPTVYGGKVFVAARTTLHVFGALAGSG